MHYFFERNLSEIKQEYTTFLVNILSPLIYEGIKSIYNDSQNIHQDIINQARKDRNIKILSEMQVFQQCLKEIPNYNNVLMEKETERIKNASKCYEWFDDLVKATVKSYIYLLSFKSGDEEEVSEVMNKKHHMDINIVTFIHKCYTECAKIFYNIPDLFTEKLPSYELKKNQNIIVDHIKEGIKMAIRKSLPMNIILKEYNETEHYSIAMKNAEKIKKLVNRDLFIKDDDEEEIVNKFDVDSDEDSSENIEEQRDKVEQKLSELQNIVENKTEEQEDDTSEVETISASSSENKIDSELNSSDNRINEEINKNVINEPYPIKKNENNFVDKITKKEYTESEKTSEENYSDKKSENNDERKKLEFFEKYLG